jgi:hypothetical protein
MRQLKYLLNQAICVGDVWDRCLYEHINKLGTKLDWCGLIDDMVALPPIIIIIIISNLSDTRQVHSLFQNDSST